MGEEVDELANPLLPGFDFDEGVAAISGANGFGDGLLAAAEVRFVVDVVAVPSVAFGIKGGGTTVDVVSILAFL